MDTKLLELLYCPVTQTQLEYDREQQVLISKAAKLVFPIHDGIPIMLESEAIQLDVWEKNDAHTDTLPTQTESEVTAVKKTAAKKSAAKKTVSKKVE